MIRTIRNKSKTQKDLELGVIKDPNESYRTQKQIRRKAMIQRRENEQAIDSLFGTIEDVAEKIEIKDNETIF